MSEEIRSLNEYNKQMIEKHKEEQLRELESIQQLTNIKCEKCDGFYRHKNYNMVYQSNPPQKLVVCAACGDEQYIIV